jgi:hypothetical protein
MTSRTVSRPCMIVINTYRKYIRVLISSLVVAVSQFSLANESHDDIRLFFPSSEHAESKTIKPGHKQVITKFSTKGADDVIDRSMVKRSPPKIWFTAVVRNGKGIQLLVNDLPCRIVLNDSLSQVESSIGVKCGHINQKHYLLRHRSDNHSLLIYKDGKYIATLFVGQSL